MKISYSWLKTLIHIDLPAEETAALLTGAGLEVESVESSDSIKGGLKGLVVGHVLECIKHPDADRLHLTKVDIGSGASLSIVCGAPNVAANQKVVVAPVGTTLYPTTGEPFDIKKSKIRGALSEGMICAEDEIGLGAGHDGIIVLNEEALTGSPASEYFNIETDHIFEIGLTPNRGDATSHLGVARDLAAVLNTMKHSHEYEAKIFGLHQLPEADNKDKVKVKIENQTGCKRYCGLVISGITVRESPDWLKRRLQSLGARPVNNIVDITNFVLHELGQPLHAFDMDKIKGKQIIVKNATAGQKLKVLTGAELDLHADDLLICNQKDPMCLAGIFGGIESGVTEKTTAIFLESAYFNPETIRSASRRHDLKTDASFRFERGTDPDMTMNALNRAANLIFEIAGGILSMEPVDVYPEKLLPFKVAFSYRNCTDLIGKEIDRHLIKQIILNLGVEIESEGTDALLLNVPRYRSDVTREADIVEEVMRIYGYNNVEASKAVSYTASHEGRNVDLALEQRASATLQGFGFNEIVGLSMTKETNYSQSDRLVKILNPLSADLNVMRADMIYSGLEAIAYNTNRKNSDLKLFETGKIYRLNEDGKGYIEQKQLSVFISGRLFKENPYGLNHTADMAYITTVLDALFEKCGVTNFSTSQSDYHHFEKGLKYALNHQPLADAGMVSPALLKSKDINQPVYYGIINWDVLLKAHSNQKVIYQEVSKFPAVRRDLALLLDRSIQYREIQDLAHATEKKLLAEVNLFDIYEDQKLGNKKSYAVSFTLLDKEATLTDRQIDAVMEKLIRSFKEKLGAELR